MSTSRMITRRFDFQPLSSTKPATPQRVGRNVNQDNSALTVWDESGNEVFGDIDFAFTSGRDRHCFNLLSSVDH